MEFSNALHDLFIVCTVEGRCGCDKDVEHDTCRPDITSLIILELKYFRSDIVGGSYEPILFLRDDFGLHVVLPLIGESEVDQLHLEGLLVFHEEVFRFEIAMCDLHGMHVLDALNYLREQLSCVTLAEISMLLKSGEELPSFTETAY